MVSFEDVRYGGYPSACSPTFDDEEPFGLKIAMPESYQLSSRDERGAPLPLPLCVTGKFDALFESRFEFWHRSLKIVLTDEGGREVITASIWRDRMYRPNPPSPLTPEELKGRISTCYRTANLREFVTFPQRSATYRVRAILEVYQSNVVTLHVHAD